MAIDPGRRDMITGITEDDEVTKVSTRSLEFESKRRQTRKKSMDMKEPSTRDALFRNVFVSYRLEETLTSGKLTR